MTAATYLPTPDQLATVARLKAESVRNRWVVDPCPIDGVANEQCANDREHGWATVYGHPGPHRGVDGFCRRCALWQIELHHTDPDWSGDVLSLDVLREPTTSKENP